MLNWQPPDRRNDQLPLAERKVSCVEKVPSSFTFSFELRIKLYTFNQLSVMRLSDYPDLSIPHTVIPSLIIITITINTENTAECATSTCRKFRSISVQSIMTTGNNPFKAAI